MSVWFKPTLIDGAIFQTGMGYILLDYQGGQKRFSPLITENRQDGGGNEYDYRLDDPEIVIEEEWHFAVITATADNNELKAFLNGELVGELVWDFTGWSSNLNYTNIGAMKASGWPGNKEGSYFSGLIDEVALFNRALSASEIRLYYQTGLAGLDLSTHTPDPGINLPQTGQTTCYDEDGSLIECESTGQDGDILAGIEWPEPRFSDNEDGTITDNLTGLMWLKDASCLGGGNWEQALESVAYFLNSSNYNCEGYTANYQDWVLPNVIQLQNLVNAEEANLASWLNIEGFSNVLSTEYWSSTTHSDSSGEAWSVNMSNGLVNHWDKSENHFAWPVRIEQLGSLSQTWQTGQANSHYPGDDGDLRYGFHWPEPRFHENGDGTVIDLLTGLVWLKNANCSDSMNWNEALTSCKNLSDGSCRLSDGSLPGDWRLPNRTELLSLIDFSQNDPAIPEDHPFSSEQSSHYWTATTSADNQNFAWHVDLYYGSVGSNHKSDNKYVLPVRDQLNHLVISSPKDGAPWEMGRMKTITWYTAGIGGNVKISLSREGGAEGTFEIIAESTKNDGDFVWTVTGPESANCVLKIEPLNDPNAGLSTSLFKIILDPFCVATASELQAALITAINNDEDDVIKIVQGTYSGNFIYASTEMYGLTLEGGYLPSCEERFLNPQNTILDAQNSGPVLVLSTPDEAADFVVNGLTIKKGIVEGNNGGGLYLNNKMGTVTLSQNRVIFNQSASRGGGVYVYGAESVLFTNNIFSNNSSGGSGGGIAITESENITLADNMISENSSDTNGGGVWIDNESDYGPILVTFESNNISSNRCNENGGGAFVLGDGAIVNMNDNIIDSNRAPHCGGAAVSGGGSTGQVSLIDNIISNNVATHTCGGIKVSGDKDVKILRNSIHDNESEDYYGGIAIMGSEKIVLSNNIIGSNATNGMYGGFYCDFPDSYENGVITATNNTVVQNTAISAGGGMSIILDQDNQSANIYNNIILDNSAAEGSDLYVRNDGNNNYMTSAVNLFNNNMDQSSTGTYIQLSFLLDPSNLDKEDPLFIDPNNKDYHLDEGSPCINAGRNDAPELPDVDMDGQPRIIAEIVDMGSYESFFACEGDFEPDGDIDGSDLAMLIASGGIEIGIFAGNFGKTECPSIH